MLRRARRAPLSTPVTGSSSPVHGGLEAVGERDQVRLVLGRGGGHLAVLDRFAGDPVELLQLRQNPAAELQILLTDQAEPAAKVFVRGAQAYQLALLGDDAVPQRVAVGDEVLDRRRSGKSDALDGVFGALGELGLRLRRYDLSQGFNHCNQLRVVGGTWAIWCGSIGINIRAKL